MVLSRICRPLVLAIYFSAAVFGNAYSAAREYPSPQNLFKKAQEQPSYVTPRAGVRPYREGGIRLDSEVINGAHVFHNYGHGGAGLTLSWGSVEENITAALPLFKNKNHPIVIFGAGVIGLTTAARLIELGYRNIRIYAENNWPFSTSAIAGGLWSPVSVDTNAPPEKQEQLKRIQKFSLARFRSMIGPDKIVREIPIFVINTKGHEDHSGMPYAAKMGLVPEPIFHEKLPIEGVKAAGFEYRTLLIDTPLYLENLEMKVHSFARFYPKYLTNLKDAVNEFAFADAKSPAVIFNCTGLGSKKLVGDSRVIPIKGQLVYIARDRSFPLSDLDYMVFVDDYYYFPRRNQIVLGGSFVPNDSSTTSSPEMCRRILSAHSKFFGISE
jgi:D-amino-acid oxidase